MSSVIVSLKDNQVWKAEEDPQCMGQDYHVPILTTDETYMQLDINGTFGQYKGDTIPAAQATFTDATGWTAGAGWSINTGGGYAEGTNASGDLTRSATFIKDSIVKITITISNYTDGRVDIYMGGEYIFSAATNGTYTYYFKPPQTSFPGTIILRGADIFGGTDFVGRVDLFQVSWEWTLGWQIKDCISGDVEFSDYTEGGVSYSNDDSEAQLYIDWSAVPADNGCYCLCLCNGAEDEVNLIANGRLTSGDGVTDLVPGWTLDLGWGWGGFDASEGAIQHSTNGSTNYATQELYYPLEEGIEYTLNFYVIKGAGQTAPTVELVNGLSIQNLTYDNVTTGDTLVTIVFTADFDITHIRFVGDDTTTNGIAISSITSLGGSSITLKRNENSFTCLTLNQKLVLADEFQKKTYLLKGVSSSSAFGFGFSNTLLLRVFGNFRNATYPDEIDYYEGSDYLKTTLYAKRQKLKELQIAEVPEPAHDQISVMLLMDTFTVDGVSYKKQEGEYRPNWRKSSHLAPAIVLLEPAQGIAPNKSCT